MLCAGVRGLFVKHTRTGNPLVDSVAEHQPGSTQAYQTYLHNVYYAAPIGFLLSCSRFTDANLFLLLYALTAYYFASKMSRLVILLGPVAAALGGVALGLAWDYLIVSAAVQLLDDGEEGADKDGKGKGKSKEKDKKGDGKSKEKDKSRPPPTFGKQKGKRWACSHSSRIRLSSADGALTDAPSGRALAQAKDSAGGPRRDCSRRWRGGD